MNKRFSNRNRSWIIVAVASILYTRAEAQSSTATEALALAKVIGITQTELQCIQALDRKCLFAFYQNDSFVGEQLQGMVYHDTVAWKHFANAFQQGMRRTHKDDPRNHIEDYKRAAVYHVLADAPKPATISIQNIAFRYDEQLHKFDSALYFTNLALERWEQKKDTQNTANLYKYRAYLSSHLKLYEAGKKDARKAVMLYSAKGVQRGVMVSYRDLATIFIEENNADSANYYLTKVKKFWVEQADKFRIVDANTQLIRANRKDGAMVEKLIAENDAYLLEYNMPAVAATSYYNAVIDYARSVRDKDRMLKYEAKRDRLNGKKFE